MLTDSLGRNGIPEKDGFLDAAWRVSRDLKTRNERLTACHLSPGLDGKQLEYVDDWPREGIC